jgi:hypothetical protein
MSYCPIDEAFGTFMTDGLNPDPLESSSFKLIKSNNCVKKNKIKKKKINCNRNSTSFSENQDDIYTISPDVTDDDMDFDNNLQHGYEDNNIDLYKIGTSPPSRNKKSKISKKKRTRGTVQTNNSVNYNNSNNYERNENLINSMNPMNSLSRVNVYENFQNYNPNLDQMNNSNSKTIKKKPKITRKKPIEKNEIYEYSQEDDMPIEELREVHGIVTNEESDSDSDLEETRQILKNTNITKQNGEMNSQISEINNKINFIMNQISNKDNEIKESEHNNIHDIILFVIFGIFVLIILEALYRLISKMVKANTILSNNISRPVDLRPSSPSLNSRLFGSRSNSRLEGSGSDNSLISSSDTFDAVREYARSKK